MFDDTPPKNKKIVLPQGDGIVLENTTVNRTNLFSLIEAALGRSL